MILFKQIAIYSTLYYFMFYPLCTKRSQRYKVYNTNNLYHRISQNRVLLKIRGGMKSSVSRARTETEKSNEIYQKLIKNKYKYLYLSNKKFVMYIFLGCDGMDVYQKI